MVSNEFTACGYDRGIWTAFVTGLKYLDEGSQKFNALNTAPSKISCFAQLYQASFVRLPSLKLVDQSRSLFLKSLKTKALSTFKQFLTLFFTKFIENPDSHRYEVGNMANA